MIIEACQFTCPYCNETSLFTDDITYTDKYLTEGSGKCGYCLKRYDWEVNIVTKKKEE